MSKEAQYIELILETIQAFKDNGMIEPARILERKMRAIQLATKPEEN